MKTNLAVLAFVTLAAALQLPAQPVAMLLRQLVGFQHVSFKAGETRTVEIPVPANCLRRWDEVKNCCVVDPGACEIVAGPASDQPLLQATLNIFQ